MTREYEGNLWTVDRFVSGFANSAYLVTCRRTGESITSKLCALPGTTAVLPGHGAFTTLSASKKEYGVFASRPRRPDLHGDVTWAEGA